VFGAGLPTPPELPTAGLPGAHNSRGLGTFGPSDGGVGRPAPNLNSSVFSSFGVRRIVKVISALASRGDTRLLSYAVGVSVGHRFGSRDNRQSPRNTEADMNPNQLSERTREALEKLPPDKRGRAEAIIALTQTPEARANDTADRAILDREFRETGRIATIGEKLDPDDSATFRTFIEALRDERLTRGISLEELAMRSKLDKAALSRLEAGKQANPTIATLMRYARALGMRLTLSLGPRPAATDATADPRQTNQAEGQPAPAPARRSGVELAVSGQGKPFITAGIEDYKIFRIYLDALGIPFSTRKGNTLGTVVIVPDPAISHDRLRDVVDRWTTAVAASRL